ncbi:ExbD/TolR family protein [Jannaschia marina]|uniref:ExbD/TolR family protein n=1 Tax=Jannaschia marina TaxID=2741674 RepID=UPI0015CAFD2B|nr:biopolymer transporter ExbD [Jannaschia marina]
MIARRPTARHRAEPTIALINVVFLMLIFFLVAGTVAPPLRPDLTLARVAGLDGRAPPDALVLDAAGALWFRGAATDPAAHLETLGAEGRAVRIVPDRAVPASRLVEVTLALRAAGAEQVFVVTERGLE